MLWDEGSVTAEDYRDEYWSKCSREDLLDFEALNQPMVVWTGKEQSHGELDVCNNGLHQIRFQHVSTNRADRGAITHRFEVHDLLSMELISAWVFGRYESDFKSNFSRVGKRTEIN